MLVLLAIAQVAFPPAAPPPPPVPPSLSRSVHYSNQSDVIRSKDYPKAAVKAGIEGVVLYRVAVSAKGRPESCTIIQSSGNAELDALSCEKIMERARFHPARDENGRDIASTLEARVYWRMP